MQMQPDFEKSHEIYFRLGIIYKQQSRFNQSLEVSIHQSQRKRWQMLSVLQCFKYIVHSPPAPLKEEDIWFQIGHVYEQQKDYDSARNAYQRVLDLNPNHPKVLQQLGWLYHQQSSTFNSQD